MGFNIKEILPGISFTIGTIICAIIAIYFLSLTKVNLSMLLSLDILPLAKEILTVNFILAMVFTALTIAFIMAIGKTNKPMHAMLFAAIGYLAGVIIGCILFRENDFLLVFAIGVIGVPLAVKYLDEKAKEAKYLPDLRAGASASGRFITIFCVVLFVYLLAISYPNRANMERDFIPQMMQMTTGGEITLSDSFSSQMASAMLSQQKQPLDFLKTQPEFIALENGDDPNGKMLVAKINAYAAKLNDPSMATEVAQTLKERKLDIGNELVNKFPIITFFAKYAWLIYAAGIFFFALFIGNLVIRTIAAIIFWIMAKFLNTPQATPSI